LLLSTVVCAYLDPRGSLGSDCWRHQHCQRLQSQ
jgi:hypothetical protein